MLGFFFIVFLCNFLHILLRPISQPRIISECIVSLSSRISTSIAMVFATFCTIIYTPVVVTNIIERARKRSPFQRMSLQWHNNSNELQILLFLQGPHNVSSAINFMAISRGSIEPGILVYVTDMVELTDKIAATLTYTQGVDSVNVTDPAVVEMREEISNRVNKYLNEDGGEGITVRRMLSVSTINNMHQDVCILAEDLMVSLIILPFHKQQEAGGRLSIGHSGFRHINRKVLRHAPCSVGILVDRGLGAVTISNTAPSLHATVIFIGGKDDREALAYAGRVARHPGVKLSNSGQTFSTLRSLEGQYGLFIVGRGGRVNSILTVGMNDWEECPELGPIGDILSASDFSVTASVLVIQQHSLKGELDGLQDEFSIM